MNQDIRIIEKLSRIHEIFEVYYEDKLYEVFVYRLEDDSRPMLINIYLNDEIYERTSGYSEDIKLYIIDQVKGFIGKKSWQAP